MTKEKRLRIDIGWLKKNLKNIVVFAGPIAFEVANEISGSWVNTSGKFNLSVGKLITILIGVSYFAILIWYAYKEKGQEDKIKTLEEDKKRLANQNNVHRHNAKALKDVIGYTTEKTKEQVEKYREIGHIDDSYLNLMSAATIVCERIYNTIIEFFGEGNHVTVNYYIKYSKAHTKNRKKYTKMIAHEGYNTEPKYYNVERLLKIDHNSYYCERLLDNDNTETIFLATKKEVAKAFKVEEEKCKYNQYVGIPIRRIGTKDKVALIEIVAHNNSVMWNDIEEVRKFESEYCEMFKEYFLFISMLSTLYETVNADLKEKKRSVEDGKSSEVSQGH